MDERGTRRQGARLLVARKAAQTVGPPVAGPTGRPSRVQREGLEGSLASTQGRGPARDFSRVPARASVQAKLASNAPGDMYEHEAERVADRVMRMAEPALPPDALALRPSLPASVQASGGNTAPVSDETEASIQRLQGGGQPLPSTERSFFERRMGVDLGQVRLHTDHHAIQSSQAIGARAFTVGNNVAFNRGEYQPGSQAGRHLMAHELTHVVQQGAAPLLQTSQLPMSASVGGGRMVQAKKQELTEYLKDPKNDSAVGFFTQNPVSQESVQRFVSDKSRKTAERRKVLELWNQGYDPGSSAYIDPAILGGEAPASPDALAPVGKKRDQAERPESKEQPHKKRQKVDQYVTFAVWNLERLGKSSDKRKFDRYVSYLLDVIESYHPVFIAFEEMGDAVADFGKALLEGDLFARYLSHAEAEAKREATEPANILEESESEGDSDYDQISIDQLDDKDEDEGLVDESKEGEPDVLTQILRGWQESLTDEEVDDELASDTEVEMDEEEQQTRQKLSKGYPVGDEYAYLQGPEFNSGNFREYYPLLYDKSVLLDEPDLIVTTPETVTAIMQKIKKEKQGERAKGKQGAKATSPKKEVPQKLLTPYTQPRPFRANKKEGKGASEKTPRGPAFWRMRMKATAHNTRGGNMHAKDQGGSSKDGKSQLPSDEVLEFYVGIVHTSPGMLNPDLYFIMKAAEELLPEGKPVLIGGDWYLQNGAKSQWKKLSTSDVWGLGLPGGTTNYKEGKKGQMADHFVYDRKGVSMESGAIRVQEPGKIPFEGWTGIDQAEMKGERNKAATAKEVKDKVGSDHTMVLGGFNLHPDGIKDAERLARAVEQLSILLTGKLKVKQGGNKCNMQANIVTTPSGPLYVNQTVGDGNCFYRAVHEALSGESASLPSQAAIRTRVVSSIINNPTVQSHLFGAQPDFLAMNGVINNILEDGRWADDFTPSFVAEALNIQINVLREDGSPYYTASPTSQRPGLQEIYLVFTGNHYNSCTAQPLNKPKP